MSKLKKFISTPAVTIAAFVLAAVLLLSSSIGGARAALTYYSETYATRVSMSSIGVSLNENGTVVSGRDYRDGKWNETSGALLLGMLAEGETVKPGVPYEENLSVTNSGGADSISQYVRVSIYRYWTDAEGNKNREVSPELIGLTLAGEDIAKLSPDSGWLVDHKASTKERTVLYYNKALAPGETTPLFADSLTIDGKVASKVTQTETKEGGNTVITTTYDYDGYRFCVDARVDAVQEHNAQDAIYSAWGRNVTISNGILSLE